MSWGFVEISTSVRECSQHSLLVHPLLVANNKFPEDESTFCFATANFLCQFSVQHFVDIFFYDGSMGFICGSLWNYNLLPSLSLDFPQAYSPRHSCSKPSYPNSRIWLPKSSYSPKLISIFYSTTFHLHKNPCE